MVEASASAPPLRVALISIAAFWTLYFVILTVRALAVYHMHTGAGNRALVSLASMGVTFLFYLLLRRVAVARLGVAIAVAAVLAAPSALLYSAINYAIFAAMPTTEAEAKRHAPAPVLRGVTIVVPSPPPAPRATVPMPPPPPASAPTHIAVGQVASNDDKDEMTPWMEIADQAANGYFFFASWASLYLALCYAGEVGRLARRASALQAAAQAAELRALRYQVNPHFLFNTLNSLSSLVMTGKQEAAERMIINLAAFFRTSLTGDPTEDVPLAEEIALQRLYLDIEGIRFPRRLTVVIDLPEPLARACVPGLILQPLVENAVRHGVARARRAVTLRITASEVAPADGAGARLRLRVEDDGDGARGQSAPGTGVGLANVRDRLRARYGDAARSDWRARDGGGFVVTLDLPLIFAAG